MGTLDFIATGFISAAFIFHNYGFCRGLWGLTFFDRDLVPQLVQHRIVDGPTPLI